MVDWYSRRRFNRLEGRMSNRVQKVAQSVRYKYEIIMSMLLLSGIDFLMKKKPEGNLKMALYFYRLVDITVILYLAICICYGLVTSFATFLMSYLLLYCCLITLRLSLWKFRSILMEMLDNIVFVRERVQNTYNSKPQKMKYLNLKCFVFMLSPLLLHTIIYFLDYPIGHGNSLNYLDIYIFNLRNYFSPKVQFWLKFLFSSLNILFKHFLTMTVTLLFYFAFKDVLRATEDLKDGLIDINGPIIGSDNVNRSYELIRKNILHLETGTSFIMVVLLTKLVVDIIHTVAIIPDENMYSWIASFLPLMPNFILPMVVVDVASQIQDAYRSLCDFYVNYLDKQDEVADACLMLKVMNSKDEASLTAWNAIPLKRGLLLTVAGFCITYGLIIKEIGN